MAYEMSWGVDFRRVPVGSLNAARSRPQSNPRVVDHRAVGENLLSVLDLPTNVEMSTQRLHVPAASQCPSIPAQASEHRHDPKSTRLNSSHHIISYAVFCFKLNI